MKNQFRLISLILVCISLGCTGGSSKLHIIKDNDVDQYINKSIVIGKIAFKRHPILIGIPTMSIFELTRISTGQVWSVNFTRSEFFFITLDPGVYRITRILFGHGAIGSLGQADHVGGFNRRFRTHQDEAIYIGTMLYEYWARTSREIITVSDEYDQAVKAFREKYPHIAKSIVIKKNLLMGSVSRDPKMLSGGRVENVG